MDAYRNKMRSTILQNAASTAPAPSSMDTDAAAGESGVAPTQQPPVPHVAPHFETRLGKRRWQDREGRGKRVESP